MTTLSTKEILAQLLASLPELNFNEELNVSEGEGQIKQKHILVLTVEKVLEAAQAKQWNLCRQFDFIYCYNGKFWESIDKDELKTFLGEAAEKMGYSVLESRYYEFRDKLFKQFLSAAVLPVPEPAREVVLVNLVNGTFEITRNRQRLRPHDASDFLRYMLPFNYNKDATCPTFDRYLERVLPDPSAREVLAEYIGYIFTRGISGFKLEKLLLLYGSGANGKSVFFEVINAMLGRENISNYSLASLSEEHNRAQIVNKLLNYGSEIRAGIDADQLKALASGEPIQARLKYGNSFMMTDYAKLAFNCNELPREVEHNEAYFRRFLIVPFEVTIPENERDPSLADRIILTELPGVFNWVLAGLRRLLENGKFTECEKAREMLERYKQESDSVWAFVDDAGYKPANNASLALKELYQEYKAYCLDSGFRALSIRKFAERLRNQAFPTEKRNIGQVVFCRKSDASDASDRQ